MNTPDEPGTDAADAGEPASGGPRWDAVHLTILALAVVVVVMIGVWGFQRIRGPQASAKFCAGVGLEGPSAPTPEAALDAFLAAYPSNGSPADWERSNEFGSSESAVYFSPKQPSTARSYRALTAYGSARSWAIGGACV